MNNSLPSVAAEFPAQTFEELWARLSNGIAWLTSMGVPPAPNSRYPYYLSTIEDLLSMYKEAPKEILEARFEEFTDVLFEAADFGDIVATLSNLQFDQDQKKALRKRLQALTTGPLRRREEISDDPRTVKSRNTAFELIVASRFCSAGFPPDFRGAADTTIKYKNCKIFLESKRCRSERKIIRLFNEAISQCNQRISQSGSSIASGIAVLDFSTVANPDATIVPFKTEADAKEAMRVLVDSFVNEFSPRIPWEKEHRIIALMIRYCGLVRTETKLSYAQQWAFVRNSNLADVHASAANHIERQFSSFMKATL